MSSGWSREIEHDVVGKVTFPVFIDCVYQQGRYDEHGVARHGYAADAPFIDTPRDAREHYSKRFGIESSYRLAKQSLAFTSSQDAGLRLVMFVVSLLLQNVSSRYLIRTRLSDGVEAVAVPILEFFSSILDQFEEDGYDFVREALHPYGWGVGHTNVIEQNLSYLNGEGKSPDVRGKGWERLTIIIQ